jgi:tagatose-1,6-bisphosphate aldolase
LTRQKKQAAMCIAEERAKISLNTRSDDGLMSSRSDAKLSKEGGGGGGKPILYQDCAGEQTGTWSVMAPDATLNGRARWASGITCALGGSGGHKKKTFYGQSERR